MTIPEGMRRTADLHPATGELMMSTFSRLEAIGVELRETKKEDVRANFPGTPIPIVTVQVGPKKGVLVEIRVDSAPCSVLTGRDDTLSRAVYLVRKDRGGDALWNVHHLTDNGDLDRCMAVLRGVLAGRAPRGD